MTPIALHGNGMLPRNPLHLATLGLSDRMHVSGWRPHVSAGAAAAQGDPQPSSGGDDGGSGGRSNSSKAVPPNYVRKEEGGKLQRLWAMIDDSVMEEKAKSEAINVELKARWDRLFNRRPRVEERSRSSAPLSSSGVGSNIPRGGEEGAANGTIQGLEKLNQDETQGARGDGQGVAEAGTREEAVEA